MSRYLYGPCDTTLATRGLGPLRAGGDCLTFGPAAGDGIDLVVPFADSWETIQGRFPEGWRPDFVALNLSYQALPAWVGECPVPVVGLAPDWPLLWSAYARCLPLCDLVLTDAPGVETLQRTGYTNVEPANLFGCPDSWLPAAPPDTERDIAVLFVGNCHPCVTRRRLPLLARLGALAEKHKVVVATKVPFDDYRKLLLRSRIVFNPSLRREWNLRVGEAVASGCLVAVEADNQEVFEILRPGHECLAFTDEDLEAVLADALADEPRRQAMARAAQEKLGAPTFARFWGEALARIEARLPALREARNKAPRPNAAVVLRARAAAQLSAAERDPLLLDEAVGAFRPHATTASAVNDLALLYCLPGSGGSLDGASLDQAARLLAQGLARRPGHPVLAYNLARLLLVAGQEQAALSLARQARAALADADLNDADLWGLSVWPLGCDDVWVEWQRLGWHHANTRERHGARRELLRWYLGVLIGDLDERTGLVAYYEAVLARPDLGRGRAALGCALANHGHLEEALSHLRRAAREMPFDRRLAFALGQALRETGRTDELRAWQQQRRLLHQAAPALVPAEPWFAATNTTPAVLGNQAVPVATPAGTRPTGGELASLIILCHNQLEVTRPCLESVLQFTRQPYEIILVDNGSTDDTPAFLNELRSRPGPARVEVIRNEQNRGFGPGCNQGIAAAQGRYLVFLNNDTVVTPGWLDNLAALSLLDWPAVGLTGPVSNAATPEQTIEADYDSVEKLLAFAEHNRQRFVGQAKHLDRLSGFCLLVRREVIEQIGGFDERFEVGFFEDDDLCLRARRAGFRLACALDVFVHHKGGTTMRGLGLDTEGLLRANLARFLDKWGADTPTAYRNARFTPLGTTQERAGDALFGNVIGEQVAARDAALQGLIIDVGTDEQTVPAQRTVPAVPALPRRGPSVSLCIIARNEEHNLRDCIAPVRHLFDQVVVNDTGSTDRTVAIARELGATVVEHPWQDSFSLARNQSLAAATGAWIFWLDADDRVLGDNVGKLQKLLSGLKPEMLGYALTCRCLSKDGSETDVTHVRLFPNHPKVRWQHRVHEQILPALRAQKGEVRFADVVVTHVGYTDPALRSRKLDRDLRLLEMERAELGDHPFTLFNLGCVHLERDNFLEAVPLFQTSLQKSHVKDSIVRKLYAQLARCHWQLNQRPNAQRWLAEGLGHYPQDDELLFLRAQYCHESGDLEGARRGYHELIEGPREADHFGSTATGLRGFRAMNNLALVYQRLGDLPRAEHWFGRAVQDHPGFVPGWVCLGEILLAQGKFADAELVAARLETLGCSTEAAALRGRLRKPA